MVVTMMCLTTKKKFDVDNPMVIVLQNGRYAYRAECPWEGKGGKKLSAFKFCSTEDYKNYLARTEQSEGDCPEEPSVQKASTSESEQSENEHPSSP